MGVLVQENKRPKCQIFSFFNFFRFVSVSIHGLVVPHSKVWFGFSQLEFSGLEPFWCPKKKFLSVIQILVSMVRKD